MEMKSPMQMNVVWYVVQVKIANKGPRRRNEMGFFETILYPFSEMKNQERVAAIGNVVA